MIYIIISNVGLAIMMILVYGRYSRLRIISAGDIKTLKAKLAKETEERNLVEQKLAKTIKTDEERIAELIKSSDDMRREKEGEIKIRVEAEKQIEVALLKVEEVQKRIQDWRALQDAMTKDSKDAIVKIGNDLFKKLSDSYKIETDATKNLLLRFSKEVTESVGKIVAAGSHAPTHPVSVSANVAAKVESEGKAAVHAPVPSQAQAAAPAIMQASDEVSKKLINDLTSTMKASGHMVNKDYFIPSNFDAEKARLMLCEMTFLGYDTMHIFDFKACHYIEEYKQSRGVNSAAAEEVLKQKLDKYLAYLANAKYAESILRVMSSTRAKFDKKKIFIIVPSRAEIQILKEIRYYEKARKLDIEVVDFDGANNLVL